MSGKKFESIGIEYDPFGIRAARCTHIKTGHRIKSVIEELLDLPGDFSREELLLEGFKSVASKFNVRPSSAVISCASGKQVIMTQVKSKQLPDAEMKKSLRSEIRRNLSVDPSGATLDYQVMDPHGATDGLPQCSVTVCSKVLIDYQTELMGKAGLNPVIIDVLPAAVANSFWIETSENSPRHAHLMLYFSPDICTVIFDGDAIPFYTRSIHFAARDVFGPGAASIDKKEAASVTEGLIDELRRSIAFYNTTHAAVEFARVFPVGPYARAAGLSALFRQSLGLECVESSLLGRLGYTGETVKGTFDLAVSLAMRGIELL